MKEFWAIIQTVLFCLGGWLGHFIGGMDGLFIALLILIVIDYITGVMRAIIDKRLNSEIGFKGIFKKILILALVGVANLLDLYVLKAGAVLRTAVIFFYISNEGVSILENASQLGLPIPAKLKTVLEQLHKKSDKDNNDDEG